MAGIIKNTERTNRISLVAGQVYTLQFFDTFPSVIQIRNNFSEFPIYMGLGSYISDENYDISIIGGGTRVFTKPAGTKFVYFYTLSPTDIIVNSWEADGLFPADIDQSQMSVLTKDTTGDSTVIVDNIVHSLPAGNNTIGKVESDTLGTPDDIEYMGGEPASVISLLKALFSKLTNIVLGAGNNTIGKVDINAGSNLIGKVDINSMPSIPVDVGNISITDPLPAGTNNIGKVDINSMPSIPLSITDPLPAGTNTIGKVNIQSSLPAGSNNIGAVTNLALGSTSDVINTNSTGSWSVVSLLKGIWQAIKDDTNGRYSNVVSTPTTNKITMANANTQYSIALPSACKRFQISVVDGDDTFSYLVCYQSGQLASYGQKYNANVVYSNDNLQLSAITYLYVSCSLPGRQMQWEYWT